MLWRRLHALILAMTLTCFFEFGLVRDDALNHHGVVAVSCSHLPVSSDALRSWFGAAGVFGVETGTSLKWLTPLRHSSHSDGRNGERRKGHSGMGVARSGAGVSLLDPVLNVKGSYLCHVLFRVQWV